MVLTAKPLEPGALHPALEGAVYEKFKYERVALSLIRLDDRNPRIVTQQKLSSEEEILGYFFEHEDLAAFIKTIASEGRNPGAERPYVVKDKKGYVVIEGNTRVATYKLLTGQLHAPGQYKASVPLIPKAMQDELLSVDVAIAPSRDALMTIMARAHFGRGDKSRWGYLGSRKAVYDDWKAGRSIVQLAHVFGRSQGLIRDLLLEYMLYLEALQLDWTADEKEVLLKPSIEFNPPVRFLQTASHKALIGVEFDKTNLKLIFNGPGALAKFKHLIRRTVIDENGPSATATYNEVFAGFVDPTDQGATPAGEAQGDAAEGGESGGAASDGTGQSFGDAGQGAGGGTKTDGAGTGAGASGGHKPNRLFGYDPSVNDATLVQLMKEAKGLNIKSYPAAGSALLRSILEVILKLIIERKNLNSQGKMHDIESATNIVIGQGGLSKDDLSILKEFKNQHLAYLNLSAHATVKPNDTRLLMVRDCVDAFVKRNI